MVIVMFKKIRNAIGIVLLLMLGIANFQMASVSDVNTDASILGFNVSLHSPEVVDAATCKRELGGVCERDSEWTTNQCNSKEESFYPCEN